MVYNNTFMRNPELAVPDIRIESPEGLRLMTREYCKGRLVAPSEMPQMIALDDKWQGYFEDVIGHDDDPSKNTLIEKIRIFKFDTSSQKLLVSDSHSGSKQRVGVALEMTDSNRKNVGLIHSHPIEVGFSHQDISLLLSKDQIWFFVALATPVSYYLAFRTQNSPKLTEIESKMFLSGEFSKLRKFPLGGGTAAEMTPDRMKEFGIVLYTCRRSEYQLRRVN